VPGSYGAILADAMGLGKTLQSISLVWTLLHSSPYSATKPLVRRALIVTPGSLVANWRLEFYKWLPWARSLLDSRMLYCVGHEGARPEDYRGQAVLLISYEMLLRWAARLSEHRIHPLSRTDQLRPVDLRRRPQAEKRGHPDSAGPGGGWRQTQKIVLTGTPVQNDLDELYTLVDFVSPGRLGNWPQFRAAFVERIAAAADSAATEDQLDKGAALRRHRLCRQPAAEARTGNLLPAVRPSTPPIRRRVRLRRRRRGAVDELGHTARLADGEHLRLIGLLRKVASDPLCCMRIWSLSSKPLLREGGNSKNYDDLSRQLMSEFPLDFDADGGLNELIDDNLVATSSSGKLSVTSHLLQRICRGRRRNCVLASNSTKTLDLLGRLSTTPRCVGVGGGRVLLLSTKAGGVGLNLTGASDLILFDIDWNPANDAQATARIWREGQRRPCSVYRLLTAGSIEERIFLRQVLRRCFGWFSASLISVFHT
uniref:Helicase ATP-binding domain-containing protein n=1 Tax=Macrostomum lignano TaxID=282301 RepID=A0A1I8F2N3_9PLAT